MTKANIASERVTARCGQMKPLASQPHIFTAMAEGFVKKKVSIAPVRAAISQAPMRTQNTPICSARTSSRRCRRRVTTLRRAIAGAASRRASAMRRSLGPLHFVAQIVPDAAIERDEMRIESDLRDIARPLQIDRIATFDARGGAGRHHHHLVGKRDRLLEIMGDE